MEFFRHELNSTSYKFYNQFLKPKLHVYLDSGKLSKCLANSISEVNLNLWTFIHK